MATLRMPSSTHIETAQARPRALNEPVGLIPSSFTQRSLAPSRPPSRVVRAIGVIPSPRETMWDASRTGSTGAYRHILHGPLATASRLHVAFAFPRSYKTSSGPPHAHML